MTLGLFNFLIGLAVGHWGHGAGHSLGHSLAEGVFGWGLGWCAAAGVHALVKRRSGSKQ